MIRNEAGGVTPINVLPLTNSDKEASPALFNASSLGEEGGILGFNMVLVYKSWDVVRKVGRR